MKKAKQKAWEFYNNWRKEITYCPALKTEVIVSQIGWKHLIGTTGNSKRSSNDIFRRLRLLPYAKQVIKSSGTIVKVRNEGTRVFYALETIIKFKKIRVILIEDEQGRKIFYSVMDKRIKWDASR